MTKHWITASSPGKVLIAGGYLVLERPNPGLVLTSTSRFFTSARWDYDPQQLSSVASTLGISLEELETGISTCQYSTLLSHVAPLETSDDIPLLRIKIHSPQFHSVTELEITSTAPYYVRLAPSSAKLLNKPNPFLQRSLELAFMGATGILGSDTISKTFLLMRLCRATLELDLRADNDFYSQIPELQRRTLPVTRQSLASLPKCLPCPQDENGAPIVAKTGMGSSAALTTSLVTAVLELIAPSAAKSTPSSTQIVQLPLERVYNIHRLAQIAHGLAQGKVGSGFDVCSACFGSIEYVRIAQEDLQITMESVDACFATSDPICTTKYTDLAESIMSSKDSSVDTNDSSGTSWRFDAKPFALPPGIDMMLADVCGGSETPSMVRKILAWKSNDPSNLEMWDQLGSSNKRISAIVKGLWQASRGDKIEFEDSFLHGTTNSVESYKQDLQLLSQIQASQWRNSSQEEASATCRLLTLLYEAMQESRRLLKTIGDCAAVPVEPDQQTQLANATQQVPGVIVAGVPGAGGHDALFTLFIDTDYCYDDATRDIRREIETVWSSWEDGKAGPLLLDAAGSRLSNSQISLDGVRLEFGRC